MICPSCHAENIEGADTCATCGQALYGLDLPGAPQGSQSPDFINQPLSSLPQRPPAQLNPTDPVALAVRLMQNQETGCVLVMDGLSIAGIITGWDMLNKVAGPKEDLNAVTCGQIMTPNPTCLHDEDTLAEALNVMAAAGYSYVPILKGDQPSGVVNVAEIFRHLSPHLV